MIFENSLPATKRTPSINMRPVTATIPGAIVVGLAVADVAISIEREAMTINVEAREIVKRV